MNNQKLDALASLASAESSSRNMSSNDSSIPAGNAAGPKPTLPSSTSGGGSSSEKTNANDPAGASSAPSPGAQTLQHQAQQQQNQAQQQLKPQQPQWQQAVQAASGMNPLAPNLALLAGIQQFNSGDPSALLAMQQQLAYAQFLAQLGQQGNAAAHQQQKAAAPAPPAGAGTAPNNPPRSGLDLQGLSAAQLLSLALAGQSLQQTAQGTSLSDDTG
jgi:hypothetical protein